MYEVECPYCGRTQSFDICDEEEFELQCDNCDKDFIVQVELEPIFYSYKIESMKSI